VSHPETRASILIIDDERGLREGCRRVLARQNYQVGTAASGQEGLSKVLSEEYDLVLLDVVMPDISGIELMKHMRVHDPELICIIMTAYATVELAVQAMKLGAYDFIEKPFSDETLLQAVERGLERHNLQKTARNQRAGERAGKQDRDWATLEELEQARSDSMREVAHELRAPIAAIRSFLTLILQGYATPEKTKEWQQRAAERADDLLQLIDDVLNLTRLKDPRTESSPELVSVEAVLEDVLGLHAPEAEAKGIWLRVQTQPCGMVVADPTHVKQLWTNLISNAIKYTSRGGQIIIRLFPERGTVVGVVKDTGIGIAQEDLPRLFEEFFRTQQAREFARYGTGLGLSIVQQIIQHYGGTISVDSELGKGTQFIFRLPASSKDARTWSTGGD